ncbi:MAG: hypothetical protein HQL93_09565 [Magnetococcales bacterium]|nr:hypothetical protein [Magnetococcales bacterium]
MDHPLPSQGTKGTLKRRPPFSLDAIPYPLRKVTSPPDQAPSWKQAVLIKEEKERPPEVKKSAPAFQEMANHMLGIHKETPDPLKSTQALPPPLKPTQLTIPRNHTEGSHSLTSLLEPHAEALIKKAIEMALNGDAQVMQTLLGHLLGRR